MDTVATFLWLTQILYKKTRGTARIISNAEEVFPAAEVLQL